MTVYSSISDININQWNDLVKRSSTSSFFQTPECYHFYDSLSFVKPFVFAISENETLKAIVCGYIISDGNILKKFFSRRAIIPGGVLMDAEISNVALEKLLKKVKSKLNKKAIYIEIRNYNNYSDFKTIFEQSGFNYHAHLNFHLNTENSQITDKNLSTNHRRNLKSSKKEGAYWDETKTLEDLKEFYEILKELYVTKVKTPLFPYEFFEKIYQQSFAKILVVRYEDKIIGGGLYVILPDKKIYEWFVCGEDKKYKNVYPSVLATWAGIEYATNNKLPCFDFMGAGKPDIEYGVRDFKRKFGGELVEHGRFLYITYPILYWLGKFVINQYRKQITKSSASNLDVKEDMKLFKIETNITQINIKEWTDFVLQHPHGNIFQTPEMYEILKNTNKSAPIIIVVKNENEKIVGCLLSVIQTQYNYPFKLVSSRCIIMGGPLMNDNNPKILDLLLKEHNRIVSKNAIFSQLRNTYNLLELNDIFQKRGYKFESHLNFVIDLSKGNNDVWDEIHEGRKSKIQKAIKSGLSVIVIENNITNEDIDKGYNIIKKVYDNADLPLAEKQLLLNAVNQNLIVLFLLKKDDEVIGCRFALKYKDQLYGWYAGSNKKYYSLFPNDLLIWETLKWGIDNNYKSFDYGGAGNPNKPYGVRNFKAQSGGQLVNFGRYEKIHSPILNKIARMGFKMWKLFNRSSD